MRHSLLALLALASTATAEAMTEQKAVAVLPKPQQIMEQARQEMAAHDEAAALTTLADYYEASRAEPSLFGVRNSYILSEWARLASTSVPARTALVALRDREAAALVARDDIRGDGSQLMDAPNGVFVAVHAMDDYLGDKRHAIALFQRLDQQMPNLAKFCFMAVQDDLLAVGERSLCLKYLGDPVEHIHRSLELYQSMTQRDPELADEEKSHLRNQVDYVIAVLAVNGKLDDCTRIGENTELARLFPDWKAHAARVTARHRDD